MKTTIRPAAIGIAAVVTWCPTAAGDWIEFVNETSMRLVAEPSVGADDPEQKYYAHGDLNNNGRMDVVVVRKQPFNSPGRRANVLLMNEGIAEGHEVDGVLVDRTAEYASSADDGGNGFLDQSNDTSVVIVDVNGNGWLDVVTSTTLSAGLPKSISHPRVYINLGLDQLGDWQGLHYESSRIPEFALEPRFIEVAAGDVTGDGTVDLFFVYARHGGTLPEHLKDRLLINDGSGFFTDETNQRMVAQGSIEDLSNAVRIADINGNGVNDIIKNRTDVLFHIGISYNDPDNVGYFTTYDKVIAGNNNTYVSVGDLNNTGRLDLLVSEDGFDRYLLNQGNDHNGVAQFTQHLLQDSAGFTGKSIIADLDGDGWNDAVVADVHWDIGSCGSSSTFARVYRNNADGPDVTFTLDSGGIPHEMLAGTFHVAALDIAGDGRISLLVGRCAGTAIWMNEAVSVLGDLNGDGVVDVSDLLILLGSWGSCGQPCPTDLNSDGVVDVSDLLILLGNWG